MVRGGSWNNKPRNCRVSNRNRNTPDNRNNNNGFRLASILHGRSRLMGIRRECTQNPGFGPARTSGGKHKNRRAAGKF
ncbi:MAG: hypothetical protein JW861_14525 [Bacteroidales bacterium]|nr:hypothetical protein [Bacteroidales bacterium]